MLSDIEVREYGYSKALWELCPQGWKGAVGAEWEDESFHYSFNAQSGLLSRRILKEHGIGLKELKPLRDIYLVRIGKEEAVLRTSDEMTEKYIFSEIESFY